MLDRAQWHDALPPGDPAGSQAKRISLFSVLFHCFCWFLLCMTKLFNSKKIPPTHSLFFFYLPLTDNLSPAVSATMKNVLTFPRRALLWHKVMDLRPPRSSDDGSSSSQRGAKLTVYLLLTLCVILHFLPPLFSPACFPVCSWPYLEDLLLSQLMRRGLSSIIVSLWQQHHISLFSLLPFSPFSSCFFLWLLHFIVWHHNDKQNAPFFKYENLYIWAFYDT